MSEFADLDPESRIALQGAGALVRQIATGVLSSRDLLEIYLRQLIQAHARAPEVVVGWQGGEPTMMGLDFFRRSVQLAESMKLPGQRLVYTIQTNGTLIDDRWAEFLAEHGVLVGLSIDGPREMHDTYRVNKAGRGSFDQVMAGLAALQRHGVEWNALTTVNAANEHAGRQVYRFLRDECNARYLQFIPIIERSTPALLPIANQGWGTKVHDRPLYLQDGELVTNRSITPEGYSRFLIDVFEDWKRRDIASVYVQMFDVALANWYGEPPSLCVHSETCGLALALEHTGDLYSCDHFVEPKYKLGNIREPRMIDLVVLPVQQRFGQAKRDTLPRYCLDCDVRFACHGGCPKDRFTRTPDGQDGLHYLCPSYQSFFRHIRPTMDAMCQLLRANRGTGRTHDGLRSRGHPPRPQRTVHLQFRPEMEKLPRPLTAPAVRRMHCRKGVWHLPSATSDVPPDPPDLP